jgi:tRNA A37 threonylcarbamoyladenosine modification protein TsaB
MELAVDTSTEVAGIALSSKGEIIVELTWHAGHSHTTELVSTSTAFWNKRS